MINKLVKFGNHKIGKDTLIFNMCTSKECPSRKKGLCIPVKKGIKCYAEKAEDQYPGTVPAYRLRQKEYWNSTPWNTIVKDIRAVIKRRRNKTRYFRFNEAGDFTSQRAINKLSKVAEGIRDLDVITYGNSARADLDFSNAKFLVKGSGHDKGNNGRSEVIRKDEPMPRGYVECPADCSKCNICKTDSKINIAFRKH